MTLTDQQRLALLDNLLSTYGPLFPVGMSLCGQQTKSDMLEFWGTHTATPDVVYAGAFEISHEALNDGEDAERGLKYLLDRARRGDLPQRPESRKAPVLLRCTTEHGWEFA